MELGMLANLEVGKRVKLRDGKHKGKTFRKESRDFYVQVWAYPTPRPKTWLPIRLRPLEMMAGHPEVTK